MHTALHKTLAALGLAAAALGATSASAAITNWDYSVSSVFLDVAPNDTTFSAGAGCQSVGSNSITWGNCPNGPAGSGRSGIGITNSPHSGTTVLNGAASLANTYTHNNNVVAAGNATLTKATIQATLNLRPTGSGLAFTTYTTSYEILFAETTNETPCAVASPANNPCNDIWVLTGNLNKEFMVGADKYYFSFFAEPALTDLGSAACLAAGVTGPCSGFTTIEGQNNSVNFMLRITADPVVIDVPEPASIALLGAGLLGLAGVRRRQQKNKA